MALFRCECKCACTGWAVIASLAIGVVTAFLRFAGVVTLAPVALIVAFGIGVGFLAIALLVAALACPACKVEGDCPIATAVLTGALGTVLFSLVLLAVPFEATSILGALLTGVLAYAFSQMLAATACWVKVLAG